jgi:hypothetical protein
MLACTLSVWYYTTYWANQKHIEDGWIQVALTKSYDDIFPWLSVLSVDKAIIYRKSRECKLGWWPALIKFTNTSYIDILGPCFKRQRHSRQSTTH